MNAATDTLKKVKTLLGLEVSLEQMKLDNGTVIEAEKFEAGESVFIVTEDEKVALPIGEYELEDGTKLIVEEDGVIATIGSIDEEEVTEALTEIVKMIEELKGKDEMKQTEVTEVEELETQLSEAATKPLKHAPKESTTTTGKFNFNKNKSVTAYDRIVAKISNIKN